MAPLLDHPESCDDLEKMVEVFDGVPDGAEAFAGNVFDPQLGRSPYLRVAPMRWQRSLKE